MKQENCFYVANLDALIAGVEPIPHRSFCLDAGRPGEPPSGQVTPGDIVSTLPHFRDLGVHPDKDGAPQMRDGRNCLLFPDETLDALFGYIGGGPACAVLFMGFGDSAFDDVLIRRCRGNPTDKELFLARLHLARAVLTATPAPRAPGRPSAAMVDALLVA